MANLEKSTRLGAPGTELARHLLNGLRRQAAAELKYDTRSEADAATLVEKMQATVRLPADKAAYAIALGYCLAPHFPTVGDLMDTRAFVVVRCRPGDDADRVGEVFSDATPQSGGSIAYNPQHALGDDVRFVLIADGGVRYHQSDGSSNCTGSRTVHSHLLYLVGR